MEIDTRQAWKLFKLLDSEGTGCVDIDDFVEVCLRVGGSASRIDIESLKWELGKLDKKFSEDFARIHKCHSKLLPGNHSVALGSRRSSSPFPPSARQACLPAAGTAWAHRLRFCLK